MVFTKEGVVDTEARSESDEKSEFFECGLSGLGAISLICDEEDESLSEFVGRFFPNIIESSSSALKRLPSSCKPKLIDFGFEHSPRNFTVF